MLRGRVRQTVTCTTALPALRPRFGDPDVSDALNNEAYLNLMAYHGFISCKGPE